MRIMVVGDHTYNPKTFQTILSLLRSSSISLFATSGSDSSPLAALPAPVAGLPGQRRDPIVLAVFVVGLASAVVDRLWISKRLAEAQPMASARRWAQSG